MGPLVFEDAVRFMDAGKFANALRDGASGQIVGFLLESKLPPH